MLFDCFVGISGVFCFFFLTLILWPLMQRVDSLEKTLMLGGIGGRRRRGWQRRLAQARTASRPGLCAIAWGGGEMRGLAPPIHNAPLHSWGSHARWFPLCRGPLGTALKPPQTCRGGLGTRVSFPPPPPQDPLPLRGTLGSSLRSPAEVEVKLKLQYFGHLMRRADSLEKTLMLGGIRGRRRRGTSSSPAWGL